MLLDDLLEAGVVELGIFGQIVYIGNNVTQVSLEQLKVLLKTLIGFRIRSSIQLFLPIDDLLHFLFTSLDATNNLFALQLLKGEDLVQFSFELSNESRLIVIGPVLALAVGAILDGLLQ